MALPGNVLVPLPSPVQLAELCSCSLSLGQIATTLSHERSVPGLPRLLRGQLGCSGAACAWQRPGLTGTSHFLLPRAFSAGGPQLTIPIVWTSAAAPALKFYFLSLWCICVLCIHTFVFHLFAKSPGEQTKKILSPLVNSCVRYTKALFSTQCLSLPSYPGFFVGFFKLKFLLLEWHSGHGNKTIPKLTTFLTSHLPSCHLF